MKTSKKHISKNTRGKSISLPEDSHVNPIVSPANDWGQPIERHLWPQMLRAIQEIMPTWVVAENVLGIVNWNDGLVFEEVQTDLETQVYQVQSADDQ